MPAESTRVPPGKTRLRTLESLDKRTKAARRAAQLAEMFESAIGANVTPAQKLQARQAAMAVAVAEDVATRQLAGEDGVDINQVIRAANVADRAVRRLQLRERKITTSPLQALQDHIARVHGGPPR